MPDEDHGVTLHAVLQLAMLCLALVGCSRVVPSAEATTTAVDARPTVRVMSIDRFAGDGAIRASGLVGYKRETQLSFDAPGVIETLLVDEGDYVTRGQRLATLRRTTVGSNATEAALARETAERFLARTQALYDKGFVSQAALDDAKLAVERANASVEMTAPADGVVLRRHAEPAQMVNAGAAVLMLGESASGMVVRAAVRSDAASSIARGAPATIVVSSTSTHSGEVVRIAAKSDDATGAFEVEVRVAAPKGLRSGQVAQVSIASNATDTQSTLFVPMLALLDARADQGVVYVIDSEGIARRRSIRTAGLVNDGVLVIDGLHAGERIVAAGAAYVRDGEPVRIAEAS